MPQREQSKISCNTGIENRGVLKRAKPLSANTRRIEIRTFAEARSFLFEDNYLMNVYCESLGLNINTARKKLIRLRDNPDAGMALLKTMDKQRRCEES